MRRSLLLRLLVLSIAVALGAVAATAVLATYSTGEQLQGELESNASLLESDQQIFAELVAYATGNNEWRGVDRLVRDLAERTGRRVALTTTGGSPIADSADGTLELPSMPSATIDAASPIGGMVPLAAGTMTSTVVKQGSGRVFTAAGGLGSPYWRITAEERQHRKTLAEAAVRCLRAKGVQATVTEGPEGVPVLAREYRSPKGDGIIQEPLDTLENDRCVPPDLTAPTDTALRINRDEVRRTIECLDEAGGAYIVVESDTPGMRHVAPANEADVDKVAYNTCYEAARRAAIEPYVAAPAKLYLGTADRFNVFTTGGLLRTAATALGVLLIAALVTALAGRRLVRPILALTGAAQRMTAGDRSTRVPVTGNDEVARLGHAFNAMAASIEHNEQQRRVLVSDVAHELRTPLSNIKGYLEASQDGVVPLDDALVRSLLEETELLGRLVSDLQELALADAGMLRMHVEERDVSDIAQQAVAAHRAQAEAAGVSLGLAASEPAVAMVDPARIRQALGNLVANAIKFTPPRGTVGVSVRSRGGVIELTVADTGQGIAPEHLPHLFDRFYRADPSRSRTTGGSGLGLAITKHLAEAHGGSVSVTSTLGQGSVFTIHLPAA